MDTTTSLTSMATALSIVDPATPQNNGITTAAAAAVDAGAATTAALGSVSAPQSTLYVRIGGAGAVQATVEVFYKRVMADPLLANFFAGVDMGKQKAKQVRPHACPHAHVHPSDGTPPMGLTTAYEQFVRL